MEENNMRKQFVIFIGILVVFFEASSVAAIIDSNKITSKPVAVEISNFETVQLYPTDDVHIRQDYPDNNEGDAPDMNIRNEFGAHPQGFAWQGVIRFDVSSVQIPDNTTLKATLYCYYRTFKDNNPAGRPFYLYRITDEWNEETVTWNTRPSCAPQISAIASVPDKPGNWMKWDVTDDVVAFIDGSEKNFGWKISDDIYWGYFNIPITRLSTKEGVYQPYLEIDPGVFNKALLIGRITDVDTSSETQITFKAQFLRYIQLSSFEFHRYNLGEIITVAKPYPGILKNRFVFGIFNVVI